MAFGKFGKYYPGGADVRISKFDLVALLREELAAVAQASAPSHALRFTCPVETCPLETDRNHVRYIFVNLLHNAIKYSEPGTEVTVDLRLESDAVCLQVADRGLGVPQAEVDRLFSPFFRASNVDSRPGTGMGLAIVKRSADLIGGKVSVNTRLNVGSVFTVLLKRTPTVEYRS